MLKKDDTVLENDRLKAQLGIVQNWMRREVQWARAIIEKESITKSTRSHFSNLFEIEGMEIIKKRIINQFGEEFFVNAPKYTLERLIDAEIYWNLLQKYPTMDALPIVISYQKIIDAWIEKKIVRDFRSEYRDSGGDTSIDKDIGLVLSKNHTLSIGRMYSIIKILKSDKAYFSYHEKRISNTVQFFQFLEKKHPNMLEIFLSDEFFDRLSSLIESKIFSSKRHESKVNYSDAKMLRSELMQVFAIDKLQSHQSFH